LERCREPALDRLARHKDELFKFLTRRWGELFGAKFDVLLYDLTSSTYFETSRRTPNAAPRICASTATAATSEAIAAKWSLR